MMRPYVRRPTSAPCTARGSFVRAYTLVEVLIVVVILGIAGAMVIPSFGQTSVLRIQGAVRTLVSDITVAQSDAIAFQRGMGIVFYPDAQASRYVMCEVSGNRMDVELDRIAERTIGGEQFGGTAFSNISLADNRLVFDEMGGPVISPGSDTVAPTGTIDITGVGQTFRISIEAYTGRVTVAAIEAAQQAEEEQRNEEDLLGGG